MSNILKSQKCIAINNYHGDISEIDLIKGNTYTLLQKHDDWWNVRNQNGIEGLAPSTYLQLCSSCDSIAPPQICMPRISIPRLSITLTKSDNAQSNSNMSLNEPLLNVTNKVLKNRSKSAAISQNKKHKNGRKYKNRKYKKMMKFTDIPPPPLSPMSISTNMVKNINIKKNIQHPRTPNANNKNNYYKNYKNRQKQSNSCPVTPVNNINDNNIGFGGYNYQNMNYGIYGNGMHMPKLVQQPLYSPCMQYASPQMYGGNINIDFNMWNNKPIMQNYEYKKKELNLPEFVYYCSILVHPLLLEYHFKTAIHQLGGVVDVHEGDLPVKQSPNMIKSIQALGIVPTPDELKILFPEYSNMHRDKDISISQHKQLYHEPHPKGKRNDEEYERINKKHSILYTTKDINDEKEDTKEEMNQIDNN